MENFIYEKEDGVKFLSCGRTHKTGYPGLTNRGLYLLPPELADKVHLGDLVACIDDTVVSVFEVINRDYSGCTACAGTVFGLVDATVYMQEINKKELYEIRKRIRASEVHKLMKKKATEYLLYRQDYVRQYQNDLMLYKELGGRIDDLF